jgi:hypothetical protein
MEAIYFSNVTNSIILISIDPSGKIRHAYGYYYHADFVSEKVAKDYIINYDYELIGYV